MASAALSPPDSRLGTPSAFAFHDERATHRQAAVAATLTAARLAVVPLVLMGLGHRSVLTAAAIIAFVVLDISDGVLARQWGTDGAARRSMDSAVDRIAIDASLVAAGLVGLIPWVIVTAFLLRDAYCILVCIRMYRASDGSVLKADWRHRSLNLSMAFGGIVAPWMSPAIRTPLALAVLAYAFVIAFDLTRMAAYVRAEFARGTIGDRVVSTHEARSASA